VNICEIACLECKKIEKIKKIISSFASTRQSWAFFLAEPSFAECWRGTRQRLFLKKNKIFAECLTRHHSTKNFLKKCFFRVPTMSALGKGCLQVDDARYLCRVLAWHSAKPLPSACAFVDHFFAEWPLPRAALGKDFADGKGAFADCSRHSAKAADPVVSSRSKPHKDAL
jgi:hypothetical protein